MTDPRGVHSAHLDAAAIAALVDRTLDPAARAAAEAHLAGCADCREVWMETSDIASDTEVGGWAATPAAAHAPAPHGRSRRWIYGGAGLAMAAALALVVFSPRMFDRGDRPELRELVEAVGSNRRTEARLTGGFQWGPVPSVTRGSGNVNAGVDLAAARLAERRARNTTTQTIAAAGVAALVRGDVVHALSELEAAAANTAEAAVWSDLAAAHLERARLTGDLSAPQRALEAADRALLLEPDLAEALFNRALALTILERPAEARGAWEGFLAVDSTSKWADEARLRLTSGPAR